MKFNMYGRTPRGKTPRWITVFIVSFFACLVVIFLMVGIIMSIDAQSMLPFLITFCCFALLALLISPVYYNMNHAYIETEGETIKCVEYLFFKKRERIVLLHDVKKVKFRVGGKNEFPYLMFKNEQNKNLFRLDYVPEVIEYMKTVGLKISY